MIPPYAIVSWSVDQDALYLSDELLRLLRKELMEAYPELEDEAEIKVEVIFRDA